MKKYLALLFSVCSLFCTSISLKNDSQFHLKAEIFNAAGQKEDTVELRPGQSFMWYGGNFYDPFKQQLNQPYAPYTVVWVCNEHGPHNEPKSKKDKAAKKKQYRSEFGLWNNVSVGATVTAMGSPMGSKTCKIPKKKPEAKGYKPSVKDDSNDGFNSFSNDGGQNWTNDAGPSPTLDSDNE